jgi:hypothetical protein
VAHGLSRLAAVRAAASAGRYPLEPVPVRAQARLDPALLPELRDALLVLSNSARWVELWDSSKIQDRVVDESRAVSELI